MTTVEASGPPTHVDPTPYRRPTAIAPDTLRLDGNEGNQPAESLLRRLASAGTEILRDYPDASRLERKLAFNLGVEPERVVVTAGADDALDRCCRSYLAGGRELILPTPGFEMLFRFAQIAGGCAVSVRWTADFPTDEVLRLIGPDTALIAMVSPNNPTGAVASAEALAAVAAATEGKALVLLDQVYREYSDHDLTELALDLPNVVLIRSFSKAWGLAGCRVGYAVAPPGVAAVLRSAGNPYPTSGMSLAIAEALLDGAKDGEMGEETGSMTRHVAEVRRERRELRRLLRSHGIDAPPSEGNFLLPDFGDRVVDVYEALRTDGVLVRHFPHREGLETRLRISLPGDRNGFDRLTRALTKALERLT